MEINVCWEIVETLGIWHLLQYNLFDWDWKAQNKEEFAKSLVILFKIQTSTLFFIMHSKNPCEETKWYSITLTILIHCNTFDF